MRYTLALALGLGLTLHLSGCVRADDCVGADCGANQGDDPGTGGQAGGGEMVPSGGSPDEGGSDGAGGMMPMAGTPAGGGMEAMGGVPAGGAMGMGGTGGQPPMGGEPGIRPMCDGFADEPTRCGTACDFLVQCVGTGACPALAEPQADLMREMCLAECAAGLPIVDVLCADQSCEEAAGSLFNASAYLDELCQDGPPTPPCRFNLDCPAGAGADCPGECVAGRCMDFCAEPPELTCEAMCEGVTALCEQLDAESERACAEQCRAEEDPSRLFICAQTFVLEPGNCDIDGLAQCISPQKDVCQAHCERLGMCMPAGNAFDLEACLDECYTNSEQAPSRAERDTHCSGISLGGGACDIEAYQSCVEARLCGDGAPCPDGQECVSGGCEVSNRPPPGTCEAPIWIEDGVPMEGRTLPGGPSVLGPAIGAGCGRVDGAASAAESVYGWRAGPGEYCILLESEFDGMLYTGSGAECPGFQTMACNDDHRGTSSSRLTATIADAGLYWIIVDGYSEREAGDFTLTVTRGPCGGNQGDPCAQDVDCENRSSCVDLICQGEAPIDGCGNGPACADGQDCIDGVCAEALPPEVRCVENGDCGASNLCLINGLCADASCGPENEPVVIDYFRVAREYVEVVAGQRRQGFYFNGTLGPGAMPLDGQCAEGRFGRRPRQTIFSFTPPRGGSWILSTVFGPGSECREEGRCADQLACRRIGNEARCMPIFDPVLDVRTACRYQQASVQCVDNLQGTNAPSMDVDLEPGRTYYVLVSAHLDNPQGDQFVLTAFPNR